VERIIVTTDVEPIAGVARRYGAEVPFLRPRELAQDDTPGIAPVRHAVQWLAEHEDYRPDLVLCLQPTSPLRTAADIQAAIDLARCKQADAVVSVTPAIHHPCWMKLVDEEGRLKDFITPAQPITCRQELPPVYALNGAIYLARSTVLLERGTWYTERTYAYVMPPERSLDVDTPWDLYLVDLVLRDKSEQGH